MLTLLKLLIVSWHPLLLLSTSPCYTACLPRLSGCACLHGGARWEHRVDLVQICKPSIPHHHLNVLMVLTIVGQVHEQVAIRRPTIRSNIVVDGVGPALDNSRTKHGGHVVHVMVR